MENVELTKKNEECKNVNNQTSTVETQKKNEQVAKKNAKTKKEVSKKKQKTIEKEAILVDRIKKLNETGKFNILPDVDINKEEKEILKKLHENNKHQRYVDLIKKTDLKPSKLDKLLKKLVDKKMIVCTNDGIGLTDLGELFSVKTKSQENRNKKFKQFVEILTNEEFEEFVGLVKSLKTTIK